jgi:hypothetical protein
MPDENENQQHQQDQQQEHEQQHEQEHGTGNAEAAKRRRQLREVEAERDALRARVDGNDRAEVERRAAEALHDPADLFSVTSLEDLRGDDGALDAGKLDSALSQIERSKPHWMKKDPNKRPDFHQGTRPSAKEERRPSFGEAIKSARNRR